MRSIDDELVTGTTRQPLGDPWIRDDETVGVQLDHRGRPFRGEPDGGAPAMYRDGRPVVLHRCMYDEVGYRDPGHGQARCTYCPAQQALTQHRHGVGERAQAEVAVECAVDVGEVGGACLAVDPAASSRWSSSLRSPCSPLLRTERARVTQPGPVSRR
jgi:hypothetical protein